METVQLNENLVGGLAKGGGRAHGGGQGNFARIRHLARLRDGPMDGAEKTVADRLRYLGEVHVKEFCPSLVDALAQIRIVLVRGPEEDGVRPRQLPIQRMAGGCARNHADAEGLAGVVQLGRVSRDRLGNLLGRARGGEAAEGQGLTVLYLNRSLGSGQAGECIFHNSIYFSEMADLMGVVGGVVAVLIHQQ